MHGLSKPPTCAYGRKGATEGCKNPNPRILPRCTACHTRRLNRLHHPPREKHFISRGGFCELFFNFTDVELSSSHAPTIWDGAVSGCGRNVADPVVPGSQRNNQSDVCLDVRADSPVQETHLPGRPERFVPTDARSHGVVAHPRWSQNWWHDRSFSSELYGRFCARSLREHSVNQN